MDNRKSLSYKFRILMIGIMVLCLLPLSVSQAQAATAITFGAIDYENLTLQVYNNSNSIVYYSTDKENWTELEAAYSSSTSSYSMDISWISATSDTIVYFKGNKDEKVKAITLPAQNSDFTVTYDKSDGSFLFENAEEADSFQWRKAVDYNWNTVSFNENSASYAAFLKTIDGFCLKGAKLIFRIAPEVGTGANSTGSRPSVERSITIAARDSAPSIKINPSKLNLNTTTAMEYYDTSTDLWMECSTAMSIEEIAPKALYENGGSTVTVLIRKEATASSTYSKTASVKIPGQTAPPTIGDNSAEVTHYVMNAKLVLVFNKASSNNAYQYCVVDEDDTFDAATENWTSVTSSKVITISSVTAGSGDKVYVRRKGIEENTTKDIALVLPSAVNSFTVAY